jgi:hypothetical protein
VCTRTRTSLWRAQRLTCNVAHVVAGTQQVLVGSALWLKQGVHGRRRSMGPAIRLVLHTLKVGL